MSNSEARKREQVPADSHTDVSRIVMRLIDYGRGEYDAEFDNMTIGDIADLIIEKVKSSS